MPKSKYSGKKLLVKIPQGEVKAKFIRQSLRTSRLTVEVTEDFKCFKVGMPLNDIPPYDVTILDSSLVTKQ